MIDLCPGCSSSGSKVKTITLNSLLKDKSKSKIKDLDYCFCKNNQCNTVYFNREDKHIFLKKDLSVTIGIKENSGPRPICYCFDYSIEDIENDIIKNGKTDIYIKISQRLKSGCWCETKNPMGKCCLGSVKESIKIAGAPLKVNVNDTDCCSTTETDLFVNKKE